MPPRAPTPRAGTIVGSGPRVLLRFARPADRKEFLALLRASRGFLGPWQPRVTDPSGKERFERLLRGRRDPANQRFLVCRRDDGAILGAFSVSNIVRGVAQSATLGVWVGAAHARRGYMREACRLVLAHAFGPLGLHRVEAGFLPRNRASRALAEGAGFRYEGLAKRFIQIAGRWQDHERWALLKEEWLGLQRAKARRIGRTGERRARSATLRSRNGDDRWNSSRTTSRAAGNAARGRSRRS